jgi:hypothetical protein
MQNRPMEVQELIQALLEARQPHAMVEVRGEVELTDADMEAESADFDQRVTGVRTELNRVVLEVER